MQLALEAGAVAGEVERGSGIAIQQQFREDEETMATAIQLYDQPKSIAAVAAQRTQIEQLMAAAMKKDIDYGTIPGTPKPTLYKPGSEKLLSMFHLAAKPVVDDLSTPDCMRYRVFVQITEMGTGRYLGEGVGEASSAETKYQWRSVVCQEEWEMTPADRRRVIWKKGAYSNGKQGPAYAVQQVRTYMEDVANTILKMAKKRAQIDAVLTVTAASDVFMQDAQEIIDAGIDMAGDGDSPAGGEAPPPRPATLQPKQGAPAAAPQAAQSAPQQRQAAPPAQQQTTGVRIISEAQSRRFYAKAKSGPRSEEDVSNYLRSVCGVSDSRQMPAEFYDAACDFADGL
jgi:hypothetical protein